MKQKLRFKTIFMSDVHLGAPECKATQASHLLKHCLCEKLVLNGDIIDGWELQRGCHWSHAHTHFVRTVLRKAEKEDTSVIYVRGNHDDVLDKFVPINFGNFSIVNEHLHETPYGRYLVVHGDGFDHVTMHYRWLAKLGSVGYGSLLRINRIYNRYRKWRGLEPFSVAKWAKSKVKAAVSHVGKYERQLQEFAQRRGCSGIICGHIHAAADKRIGGVHYLNSGDWVESLTIVVENLDRTWEVLTYIEFCARSGRSPKELLAPAMIDGVEDHDGDEDPVPLLSHD